MTNPSKEAMAAAKEIQNRGRQKMARHQVEEIIDRHFAPVRAALESALSDRCAGKVLEWEACERERDAWRGCSERLAQCCRGDSIEARKIALAEFERLTSEANAAPTRPVAAPEAVNWVNTEESHCQPPED